MRVAHVITRLIQGGAQENTVASVLGLAERPGMTVNLISGPTSGSEGSLEPVFSKHPGMLDVLPELVRPVRPFHDWKAYRKLCRIFRRERPDLVHTHSGKAGVLGRLAAGKAGVPLIIHTIHGPSFGPFQGAFANTLFLSAERLAARVTHHFVSVADAMTLQYLASGIGRPEQYTRVLSGFDLEPFLQAKNEPALRSRWQLDTEDIVIGKVARLSPLKGHDDLLNVAPELIRQNPRIKLLLVGDGPLRSQLETRVRELKINRRVIFTGLVKPVEVASLMGIMDIVVHLSRREGLPRALSQALTTARPVVAFDCDGAREVCLDNETGFLIQPDDRATLTSRILQLANDEALRHRLGGNGRQMAAQLFSVEHMVDELERLYHRLALEHGRLP